MRRRWIGVVGPLVLAVVFLGAGQGTTAEKKHKKEHAGMPTKELKVLFPAATSFSSRDCKPGQTQIAVIEQQIGAKLTDEELHVKCWVGLKKGADGKTSSIGVAWMTHGEGSHGDVEIGLALDPKGKVLKLAVFEHEESKAIERPEFLKQFEGKDPTDLFKVGQDIKAADGEEKASQFVASAAKKAALVIHAVVFSQKTQQ